jgi:ABC-type glycerol-3-phosphate transport system substrate-binding protein
VVVVRDEWLPQFAASLQPLNALLSARDLREIPEGVKRRLRFAGNLYGVPWSVDAWALFYRPDVLAAAGQLPPRTWEELVVSVRRVHRPPDLYGFGLPGIRDGGAAQLLLQLLWAQGADLPAIGESRELDLGPLAAALTLYQQLHTVAEPEVLSWDVAALGEFFAAGRLAMIVAPASLETHLRRTAPDFHFATAALPAGAARAGQVAVDLAVVLKRTTHLEASVALLKAFTTPEACAALTRLGSVPFHGALATRCLADPALAAYVANLDAARGLPLQGWETQGAALSDGLLYLLTGRKSVGEAAELIQGRLAGGLAPAAEENQ